jgi:hypothetical protein
MASSWVPGMNERQPEFGGISEGLWATTPDVRPDENGQGRNKSNAYLENWRGQRIYMWLNEITSNFSMAGSTAQSKRKREFYAHNFVQPAIGLAGQTPNTYQFNRLSEFIRESHLDAMNDGDKLLLLRVIARGEDFPEGARANIRGKRQHIAVDGYINTADRGAERFVNAPDFNLEFTVSRVHKLLGIQDDPVFRVQFTSIMDLIKDPPKGVEYEQGGQPDTIEEIRDEDFDPTDIW